MIVRIKVTSTQEHVLDIGGLNPKFIRDLVLKDDIDGSYLAGSDWSIEEMSEGDTTYEIVDVEVTPVPAVKKSAAK